MNDKLVIKKCMKCGAVVKVFKDCECACGFECCGEKMVELVPNTADAAAEKHIPTYKIEDGKIIVDINHVMDADHYIEWVTMVTANVEWTVRLEPGQNPQCRFRYEPDSMLYAYCNKHGLWAAEVK